MILRPFFRFLGPTSCCESSIEVSKESLETIDGHLAEGETREEFIEGLVYYEAGVVRSGRATAGRRSRHRSEEPDRGTAIGSRIAGA